MACNHKDCPISPVDQHVKKQVLFDAVDLMLQAREKGGVHALGETFRSLTRVHPSPDEKSCEIYGNLKDLRHYFLSLTRGMLYISSYKLHKILSKTWYLRKHRGIRRLDLTILFQKAGCAEGHIRFFQFFALLVFLQKNCCPVGDKEPNVCDFIKLLQWEI